MIPKIRFHTIQDLRGPFTLLYPYLLKHWSAHAGLVLFVLLDIGLTLAFAWFMGNITDAAVERRFHQLKWLVPCGTLLIFLSLASSLIYNRLEFAATQGVKKDVKEHLLRHLLLLPSKKMTDLRSGEMMTYFTQDIHGIDGLIGGNIVRFIKLPLIFIAVFLYMIHIHWMLALLSLLLVPIALLAGAVFGILLRRNSRIIHQLYSDTNSMLNELFLGMHVVRSFTMEQSLYQRYEKQNQSLYNLERKDTWLRGWFHAGGGAASSIAFLMSLSLGAYFVSDDIITIGSLMAFVNLTNHLIYPLTGLAGMWAGFQRSLTSVERLQNVFGQPTETAELPAYSPGKLGTKHIEYRNIKFGYEGQSLLFDGFHLPIPAGKKTAIVGASGAGKTTLFHLLLGFYKPLSGEIVVDGIRIDDISPANLRSSIAHVPQESFLFSGTIRDNLLLARPGITEAEMMLAATHANIHDFVMSLPNGYDTEIGERGVKLSGGQKQRIAIARAILKDAPILLLDEATSALDSETEFQVKEALDRLMRNRTTLIIAHRLSTVRNADLIVVLDKGSIVQMGTHEELASMRGTYRELHRRQYFTRRSNSR